MDAMRDDRASYFTAWDKVNGKWGHNLEEARRKFLEDATVTDGVVRWNSNNAVPPLGILQHWMDLGLPFDFDKSRLAQEQDTARFIAQYRKTYKGPSAGGTWACTMSWTKGAPPWVGWCSGTHGTGTPTCSRRPAWGRRWTMGACPGVTRPGLFSGGWTPRGGDA